MSTVTHKRNRRDLRTHSRTQKVREHISKRHRQVAFHVNRRPALFVPLIIIGGLTIMCVILLLIINRGSPLPALQVSDTRIVIVTTDEGERVVPTRARTVSELLDRLELTLNPGDVVEPAGDSEIFTDNYRVNVYRARPVTIVDSGAAPHHVLSAATTPRSISRQAELTVYPEDTFSATPPTNFTLSGSLGQIVSIQRSVPVALSLYGQPLNTRTQAKTVGELLTEKKVQLRAGESVQPEANTPVAANMAIFVNSPGVRVETVTEQIPFQTQTIEDPNLSFGTSAVRQQGIPGQRVTVYQINVETGQRTQMQAITMAEPVTHIVVRGKVINIPADKESVLRAAGISPSDYGYVNHIFSKESGWNAAAASRNGYYGLGQTNLGSISGACPNWQNDPVCQTRFFTGYATRRYGSWQGAYNFWTNNHWW